MKKKKPIRKKKLIQKKKEGVPTEQKKKSVRLVHQSHGKIGVPVDKILMAKSAKHKIEVLAMIGVDFYWCVRNCSLDEFLILLSDKKFERVNKFYLLNRTLTLGFDHKNS